MMATVLRARRTRNVRSAAKFPKSTPIVTYLIIIYFFTNLHHFLVLCFLRGRGHFFFSFSRIFAMVEEEEQEEEDVQF